jgi:hypothetical protein
VAPARLRMAASAGVVAASMTIVGPTVAIAVADPGRAGPSHSRADKSSGRKHGGDRHGGHGRSDRGNGRHQRDHDGRGDHDRDGWSTAGGAQAGTDGQAPSRPVSNAVTSNPPVATGLAPQATPPVASAAGPATAAGGGGSGGARPAGSFVAPKVTFGDGRTPGVRGDVAQPQPTVAAGPAQSPGYPAPAAGWAPVDLSPVPEVMRPPTALHESGPPGTEFIDRVWAPLRPAFPGGLVFGIAGLLIAPLAGVWLGHRQARAAEAVAQLADR